MKLKLYSKLAVSSIIKNKPLFIPHILSGVIMTAVFFILYALSGSSAIEQLPAGGVALVVLLKYSAILIGFFSIPFLIYTNTTLFKNRAPEFGLYNVLGIGRIAMIPLLFLENLLTYGIVIFSGLFIGSLLFKLAETILIRIMKGDISYSLHLNLNAAAVTIVWYAFTFLILFLSDSIKLLKNSTVDLLRTSHFGDNPLKHPRLSTILGMLILACSYLASFWVGSRGESPTNHSLTCFNLTCGIIISTYLLFVAGSIYFCQKLQQNSEFYFTPKHFITISSLKHRMHRNGSGLASICILATFVLLTLTFSFAFYRGCSTMLNSHYPNDLSIVMQAKEDTSIDNSNAETIEKTLESHGLISQASSLLSATATSAYLTGIIDMSSNVYSQEFQNSRPKKFFPNNDDLVDIRVISLEDYNKLCKTDVTLDDNTVLIMSKSSGYTDKILSLIGCDGHTYAIKTTDTIPPLTELKYNNTYPEGSGIKECYVVVPDISSFLGTDVTGKTSYGYVTYYKEYDVSLSVSKEEQLSIGNAIVSDLEASIDHSSSELSCATRVEKSDKLSGLSGGLLFLAFIVSLIFILMASLIIYYKQISEGYEDSTQFDIMRKVGLSLNGIHSTVNFQLLLTFFSPIIISGLHLLFLTPILYRLLAFSIVCNKSIIIMTTILSFCTYSIIYFSVYKFTSNSYLKRIAGKSNS